MNAEQHAAISKAADELVALTSQLAHLGCLAAGGDVQFHAAILERLLCGIAGTLSTVAGEHFCMETLQCLLSAVADEAVAPVVH